VFEIFDTSPENNRALFGGGRYDNLLQLFGKQALSGVGFGMGDVGLENFLTTHGLLPDFSMGVDVLVSLPSLELRKTAELAAYELRGAGLKVITPLATGSFGQQLKIADKHRAKFAVLFGDAELANGQWILKKLSTGEQWALSPSELIKKIKE
jgi:histidyl-tRNA synthetase